MTTAQPQAGFWKLTARSARDALLEYFEPLVRVWDRSVKALKEIVPSLRFIGQLNQTVEALKQQRAILLELGDKEGLQRSYEKQAEALENLATLELPVCLLLSAGYGNQSMIPFHPEWLQEALSLYKKQAAVCMESGDKDGLMRSYQHQLSITIPTNQWAEALEVLGKQEIIYRDLGSKLNLAYYYWLWGFAARKARHDQIADEKLQIAFEIFSELDMVQQLEAIRKELYKSRVVSAGS